MEGIPCSIARQLYQLSIDRLHSLLCWLKQDLAVFKEYDDIIQKQLEKGIIEAVPIDEAPPMAIQYCTYLTMLSYTETRPQQSADGIQCLGQGS